MAEFKDAAINNLNSPNCQSNTNKLKEKDEAKTDKEMEPYLVEDLGPRSVPRSFKEIRRHLQEVDLRRLDYMIILIHIITLEVGFVPLGCTEHYNDTKNTFDVKRILNVVRKIPKWKEMPFFVEYVLPPFAGNVCKMLFTPIGDDLLLNCTVANLNNSSDCTLLLDPSLYVMTSTVNMENKLQNVRNLSRIVKDNVCNYAKHNILIFNKATGIGLVNLPTEVIYCIVGYLRIRDLASLERTCKFFRFISNDKVLWRRIRGDCVEESYSQFKTAEKERRMTIKRRRLLYVD